MPGILTCTSLPFWHSILNKFNFKFPEVLSLQLLLVCLNVSSLGLQRKIGSVSVLEAEARKRGSFYSFMERYGAANLCLIVRVAIIVHLGLDTASTKRDRVDSLSIIEMAVGINDLEPARAIVRGVDLDDTSRVAGNAYGEGVREANAHTIVSHGKPLAVCTVTDHDLVRISSSSLGNDTGERDTGKSDSGQQSKDRFHFQEFVEGLIGL